MLDAIFGVAPLAVGAALSPPAIIVVILLLAAPNPRRNASLMVLGWFLPFLLIAGVSYALGSVADAAEDPASSWASIARVVFGAALLFFALRTFRRRPRQGEPPNDPPAFFAEIDSFTAWRSTRTGLLLAGVDPTNWMLSLAATSVIFQLNVSAVAGWVGVLAFALIASSAVAAPLVYYLLKGDDAEETLADVESWLLGNMDAITVVMLLIFGVLLLSSGIEGLTPS